MDLRRERKRSLKVREQQQAELERIEATKKRRCQKDAEAKAVKRQSPAARQKEAEAKAVKRQSPAVRHKEAEAMAVKRQSPAVRQKETEAMAVKRQSETEKQKEERRQKDSQSKKRKRASLDSDAKENQCRQESIARKQRRIGQSCTLLEASHAFTSAIKEGPDYVCMCCNRLMYRKTVLQFQVSNYDKAPSEFVVPETVSAQDKQWICKTCHSTLKRGRLPAQAKANNLNLDDIPVELSELNPLETRLISLRIPFMKMVALPCGKQRAIHGPAVNVPTDLTPVCTLLPRLPSQTQMVPMKLKRKLCYKGHYMYQYVRPAKVLAALQWLKLNNPLYKDIEINSDWLSDAAQDNAELWEALSPEHCPPPPSSTVTTTTSSSQSMNALHCPPPPLQTVTITRTSQPKNDEATLNTLARERGFSVRDVPRDGDCLFSSIAVQLDSLGIQHGDTSLREPLVEYLQSHPYTQDGSSHLREFVSAPVVSGDPTNADTEAPSEQDQFISSIEDPQLQQQLRWLRYLERLNTGAWGDHIAVQGLADMLHVDIHIISTFDPDMDIIRTSHNTSTGIIHLGLIGQFHYQALERLDHPVGTQSSNHKIDQPESSAEDHDKEFIEDQEAFKYQAELRGLPYDSFLQREDTVDATTDNVFAVAPGEGQKPIAILSDQHFEEMCNPTKYPSGRYGLVTERKTKLSVRKYFNQRLLDADGRFARDIEYLLTAQYAVESKQVASDASIAMRQTRGRLHRGQVLTAGAVRNQQVISEMIQKDYAYRFLKNVRGSPAYFQRVMYDVLGMIRQLGIPTWFLTLSAADMQWPDVIQTIARQYGTILTNEDVKTMSFEEKSKWLRQNPVTAARHFQYRLNTFFQVFLKSSAHPLGELVDYAIRIEFQARGSPHAHTILWIKDAPKLNVDTDEDVCSFIDQYVKCNIPNDEELAQLVSKVQRHRHSATCRRHGKCRFHYPRPPSPQTMIARQSTAATYPEEQAEQAVKALAAVRKVLDDKDTPEDISMDELLSKANVSHDTYLCGLKICSIGNSVVMKRKPSESWINTYNPDVIRVWRANMDLQYILDPYACVMYIAAYMLKSERSMGELLKQVSKECSSEDIRTQLRRLGSVFLNHREVSAQEAVYRILSMPLKQMSRKVVFINTAAREDRVSLLKPINQIQDMDEDSKDIYQTSLIDRYAARPDQLNSMCLAVFAANYTTHSGQEIEEDEITDALPIARNEKIGKCESIKLKDGLGRMYKRKREAIIRFHRFNQEKEPSKVYRSKIMLYIPWRDESSDLLGGYMDFHSHYEDKIDYILENEQKYTQNATEIDEAIDDLTEHGPPEHAWDQVAPSAAEQQAQAEAEGAEEMRNIEQEDLDANAALFQQQSTLLLQRFALETNRELIPPDKYRELMRGLNTKQRQVVNFHRRWCKDAVIAMKKGEAIKPYRVFLSGPGGVGKSYCIQLIYNDTLRLMRLSGQVEPEDVIALLTAPTGVAAFNIQGMTVHSALLLGTSKFTTQPLTQDKLNTLRTKLSNLQLLIIDEISMVGSNMLLQIHQRLQQLKGKGDDTTFGDISILAVGDLYQLRPVAQPHVFAQVGDAYARLHKSGSLWLDEFKMIELDEIMRQRGDSYFAQLLCRVRSATCTKEDIKVLESRTITDDHPDYPHDALHAYPRNRHVDEKNKLMLQELAPEDKHVVIKSIDKDKDKHTQLLDLRMPEDKAKTGGLVSELHIAVGAKVMLTVNVDVSDGLVNGARGTVQAIIKTGSEVTLVLVKFNHSRVGAKAIVQSQYRSQHPEAVPISRHEAVFCIGKNKAAEVSRRQFPLVLAWATTIHKVQGLTMDQIVVDMVDKVFDAGQAYVAFSRVKTLEGLFIKNFKPANIRVNADVVSEMTRLSTQCLPSEPVPKVVTVPRESWIKIVHLNVHSYLAKLEDIIRDEAMKQANIMCFTETFLWSQQQLKYDQLPTQEECMVCRLDREQRNNADLAKGGIMVVCPESLQPVRIGSQRPPQLEVVTITATSTHSGCRICVLTVYRRPQQQLATFLSLMDEFISSLPQIVPTIILGDFNDDLLSTSSSSELLQLMTSKGFTQLIQVPTTDSGSLLDHIYCNSDSIDAHVDVIDTYYSDHDATYLSLCI